MQILNAPQGLIDSLDSKGIYTLQWLPALAALDSLVMISTDANGLSDTMVYYWQGIANHSPIFVQGNIVASDSSRSVYQVQTISKNLVQAPSGTSLQMVLKFQDIEGDRFSLSVLNAPTHLTWFNSDSILHISWKQPSSTDTLLSVLIQEQYNNPDTLDFHISFGAPLSSTMTLIPSRPTRKLKQGLGRLFDLLGRQP